MILQMGIAERCFLVFDEAFDNLFLVLYTYGS